MVVANVRIKEVALPAFSTVAICVPQSRMQAGEDLMKRTELAVLTTRFLDSPMMGSTMPDMVGI